MFSLFRRRKPKRKAPPTHPSPHVRAAMQQVEREIKLYERHQQGLAKARMLAGQRGLRTEVQVHPQLPRRLRGRRDEVGLGQVAAGLEQEHVQPSLGQLLHGDAAAGSRADDDDVEPLVDARTASSVVSALSWLTATVPESSASVVALPSPSVAATA